MKRSETRHKIQNTSLGFVAGYVDTLGFVSLFGLFTAHITGNFVLIGAELARPQNEHLLLKFLAFPSFIFGVIVARFLIGALIREDRHALWFAYLLQMVFLSAFMVVGYLASPIGIEPSRLSIAAGMAGAMAMGAHSATSRLLLPHLAPTAMMTGNVTQLVIDGVDILRGAGSEVVYKRFIRFTWLIVAFAAGAIGAALIYLYIGFFALLLPIGILIYLMYQERTCIRKIRKHHKHREACGRNTQPSS
jgi:uncharacterized membrane protein YoaK (UPF0700 family)